MCSSYMRRDIAVMPGVMFNVQAASAAGEASARTAAAAMAVPSFFIFINWP